VAEYVANHYRANVEPLGYKAFLVSVDREACALYKKALDEFCHLLILKWFTPAATMTSPYSRSNHIDEKKEKAIRKNFTKYGELPKILIVTEKTAHWFRCADSLCHVSRQTDARSHLAPSHCPRQSSL